MVAKIDGSESRLGPGESTVVRPGQSHTFRNGKADEPLVMDFWFDPAGNAEWMLQSLGDLATIRGGSWSKAPLLESAYILFRVRDEYRLAGMPGWVQDALFAPLAGLAKVTGRAKQFPPPPVFRA